MKPPLGALAALMVACTGSEPKFALGQYDCPDFSLEFLPERDASAESMKSKLRALVSDQEAFYADFLKYYGAGGTYSPEEQRYADEFFRRYTSDGQTRIRVTANGWTATIRDVCTIVVDSLSADLRCTEAPARNDRGDVVVRHAGEVFDPSGLPGHRFRAGIVAKTLAWNLARDTITMTDYLDRQYHALVRTDRGEIQLEFADGMICRCASTSCGGDRE